MICRSAAGEFATKLHNKKWHKSNESASWKKIKADKEKKSMQVTKINSTEQDECVKNTYENLTRHME